MNWEAVKILAFLALAPLGVAWSLWGVIRFAAWWRYLAGVPLAVLVVYCAKIAVDFLRDPTSHNLLPFELAAVAAPSFVYMLLLEIVRLLWLRRRRSTARHITTE